MTDVADPRTHTIRWADPAQFADPISRMNGLDFMRAFLSGDLPSPPFMELLGVRIVSVDPGSVSFEFEPREYMYSPLGNVHGGILTVLLDTAMGCSFHTTLPPGVGYTTLELKVSFHRSVSTRSGPLRATGRILHAGSRVAAVEAKLADRSERVFAHATSTLLILKPET